MSTSSENNLGCSVRLRRAERLQIRWRDVCLDEMVAADHPVRAIWQYIQSLDLSPLHEKILAVEGHVGRDATDPAILMALWMYAITDGISSARKIATKTTEDWIYAWICGDVSVNYHMVSDFRTEHGAFLERLLVDSIAALMHQQVVTLNTVAQDGMRVRANAGASSFRREKSLEACRDAAAEQLQKLDEESDSESKQDNDKRRQASKKRAATERSKRVAAALENLKELQQQKEKRQKGSGENARSSTTDPDARVMKMADGGHRPAMNVQFASDADSRMIVGVEVSNNGSDAGQMSPMHRKLQEQYGGTPENYLVDGGFPTIDEVTKLEQEKSRVIGPIPRARETLRKGKDPHARGAKDTDEMARFRERMATDEAKAMLKLRPSVAEFSNATCRNNGLHQFPVRGLRKAKVIALWHALVHNFMRMRHLGLA